ncbi:Hypothetical predicted protein [Paramuricea clavata]|uniref:Uncharacterized protein n=1 Tax=Paramuricea clavata TaxID=317549 RepID=A0A6S7HWG7_PARCT|nr:Hypothetical predicted protein [Paramuricea clavata]
MSGQESDSASSCQYSDDSDINFIPGYIMEDAQAKKDCDSDEGCSCFAYAEEPLADEAWLETYHREEQQRLKAEEQFTKRLNCSVEISEWRVPLPSCAYTAIRKAFPTGKDEAITGYAEESD